jgi:hypothetical protein
MRRHIASRLLLGLAVAITAAAPSVPAQNWPMFGGDLQSTSANLQPTGITSGR